MSCSDTDRRRRHRKRKRVQCSNQIPWRAATNVLPNYENRHSHSYSHSYNSSPPPLTHSHPPPTSSSSTTTATPPHHALPSIAPTMNIFRLTGDLLHLSSILILIFTIHSRRSAEGISLLTQSLYALVFLTRYVDLLTVPWGYFVYNTVFKLFYIMSSLYILFLMLRVYARTREEEREWKVSAIILAGSVVAAPIFQMVLGRGDGGRFTEVPSPCSRGVW